MVEIVNPGDLGKEPCTKPGGDVRDGVCVTCGTVVDLDAVVLNREEIRQDELARVVDGDLIARAVASTAQCGPCDFGLVEFRCSCKDGEDPRAVIVDLVRVLEKWGERAQLLSASTMGEAYDRLEELLEKEKSLTSVMAAAEQMQQGAGEKISALQEDLRQARRQTAEELIAAIVADAMNDDEAAGAHVVRRWLEKEGKR